MGGALASCGGGKAAADKYSLIARSVEATACRGNVSIKFHTPNAAPGIDNARIAVLDRPNHLTFYQGVGWSTSTPRLVQHFLADAFEQSGMFASVSTDMDMVPADYEVESDLRAFHVDAADGAPRVRIRLTATVSRADGARPVKTVRLNRDAPIDDAGIEEIVAIFAEQMQDAAQELQQQLAAGIAGCRH